MTFAELSEVFYKLETTASRNQMTQILSDLFEAVSADEIEPVSNLSLGRLTPLYDRTDFNLAEKMVLKAIVKSLDLDPKTILTAYRQTGDLGQAFQELRAQSTGKADSQALTITKLYQHLLDLALDSGTGSQERKVQSLAQLLTDTEPQSGKYIIRIILGKLRLGFSDLTLLDALSLMQTGDKTARPQIEQAYQVYPNVGRLAKIIKTKGLSGLDQSVDVTLGVPVIPALAQRLKSADEMIKKMGKVLVEPKYDGTRVQIHINKPGELSVNNSLTQKTWQVKTFTRNLDETTPMFPELLEALNHLNCDTAILDSEAIGYDPVTGALLPFQTTITRKRKHGIKAAAASVPLRFFVYDLLSLNGQVLIQKPLFKRRQLLERVIKPGSLFTLAPAITTDNPATLRDFHFKQLAEGYEGALVKKFDAPYRPGRRGYAWVKFKEVEEAAGKLSDTIDGVVIGYYDGKGKRAQFGIGAFLIALPSDKNINHFTKGNLYTIAKIGTGLSDSQWQELKTRLETAKIIKPLTTYQVDPALTPDFWVAPEVIVEVAADEISVSPVHSANLALRFPRLVRFRDDKSLEQATTLTELEQIKA